MSGIQRRLRRAGAAAVVLAVLSATASAAPRVALVIGNASYAHAPALANPLNDAADVGASFERLGFSVTRLENAGYAELRRGLLAFQNAAAASEVAVVFYAGHGIEVDQRNFLVPVDARLASDQDVEFEAVPLELVSRAVERASGLRLVILDACRENPFAVSMQRAGATRSIGRGLARVEPSGETLVAYAAKEGTVASDGSGRNSPYTEALLRYLEEPGLEVGLMFRRVRDAVLATTGGRQEPFTYGSLSSKNIYFIETAVIQLPDREAKTAYEDAKRINTRTAYQAVIDNFPDTVYATLAEEWIGKLDEVSPPDQTAEIVFWETIKESEDPADFEAYLNQYPDGLHAQIARHRRGKLRVEADDRAYSRADLLGTSEGYREYLVSYPSGRNVERAREHLQFTELLGRNISSDVVDESGWTDLHYAAVMDLPRIADALLKAGMSADVRLNDTQETISNVPEVLEFDLAGFWSSYHTASRTPLMLAVMSKSKAVAEFLMDAGANVNAMDFYGYTPLYFAGRAKSSEFALLLIHYGADMPLIYAATANDREFAQSLLDRGAQVNSTNARGETPLFYAARENALDVAELLIEHDADVNSKASDGETPLFYAARENALDVAELLIEHGADISVQDTTGWRPLHIADRRYTLEVANLLIERGADVNGKGYRGETPLFGAAWYNARNIVELLIERGADISLTNDEGKTALFEAAGGNDSREVAKLLIDLGLDVNARDNNGSTPLHNAAYFDARETAKLLIERGAHINAKDNDGNSPMDRAFEWGNLVEMRALLTRHGGRCTQRC